MDDKPPSEPANDQPAAQAEPALSVSGPQNEVKEQPVPIARMVALPGATRRSFENIETLLYPLSRKQAIVDVLVVLVLAFLCDAVATTLITLFYNIPLNGIDTIEPEVRKSMLFPLLSIRCATTVAMITVILRFRGNSIRSVGLSWSGFVANAGIGIVLTLVVYGLIFAVLIVLSSFWSVVERQMNENANVLKDMLPDASPLAFFGMSIAIGIYEEMLFRGFIMPRIRRATGSWFAAVLLSTALFTALHAMDQTAAALIVVAILSISFSVVTIWRRSIVPAIVAHALFDFSQFLFLMLQRQEVVS